MPAAPLPFAMAPTPPAHRVLSTRVELPKPETPITYREEVYVIEPGASKHAVEVLLRERFARVRSELRANPPGQLVRLAVFDVAFEGRPPHPPLGTLAWKDWRGEPVLGFPFFGEAAPPMTSSLPPRRETDEPVAIAPAPRVPPDLRSTPPPPDVDRRSVPPASEAAERRSVPPVAENAARRSPPPSEAAATPPSPDGRSSPAAAPGSSPPPRVAGVRRAAADDLIGELFERLGDLMFVDGIVSGAALVADALLEVVPSEYALIQVFDLNHRNFVVVRARGPGLERALLAATPDTDPLVAEVMRRPHALAFEAAGDPRFQQGRWRLAATPLKHVLAGGVSQSGRYLGMIELANPAGDAPYGQNEMNALVYACEQLAELVATHPVVIDPDVVLGS